MKIQRLVLLVLPLLAARVTAYGKQPGSRQLELLKREPEPPSDHTTSIAVFAAGW